MAKRTAVPSTRVALYPIPQSQLGELFTLREKLAEITAEAKRLGQLEEALASRLLADLDTGAPVESGWFTVSVKETKRVIVAWREEYEKVLGKDAAKVLANTTPPRITRAVVVAGRGQ